MRRFHRGQPDLTLIRVLVLVAILGVLAAVMVANVDRFFGKGQTEVA
jgi:type IV pilus assembly protein PilA